VLVCGRFHLYEILRVLRSEPDVSWAVLAARSGDGDKAFGYAFGGWGLPGEERAMVPTPSS
jgi:hypothetical protein